MAHDTRRAYRTEIREDARSLERVLARLMGDPVEAQSKVLFLPHISQHHEGISTMQHSLETLVRGKTQYAGLLTAVLFLIALLQTLSPKSTEILNSNIYRHGPAPERRLTGSSTVQLILMGPQALRQTDGHDDRKGHHYYRRANPLGRP